MRTRGGGDGGIRGSAKWRRRSDGFMAVNGSAKDKRSGALDGDGAEKRRRICDVRFREIAGIMDMVSLRHVFSRESLRGRRWRLDGSEGRKWGARRRKVR